MRSFKRVTQISQSHCGPAVVQMLLGYLGINISQEEITSACGAERTIIIHGTRIDQLANAVEKLTPQARFFYKENASLEDIEKIIKKYGYPVGVEWQGIFLSEEDEDDEDAGHYSVILKIDPKKREITMADPAKDYQNTDHIISYDVFLPRWWDTNLIIDPKSGKNYFKEDKRALFVIVPGEETFPDKLKMKNRVEL